MISISKAERNIIMGTQPINLSESCLYIEVMLECKHCKVTKTALNIHHSLSPLSQVIQSWYDIMCKIH